MSMKGPKKFMKESNQAHIRFKWPSESDIYLEFEQPSTTVSQSNRDFHVFFRRKSVQSQKKVLKYDARALEWALKLPTVFPILQPK